MNILSEKNYKSSDSYTSRYASFPFYYNKEDDKYVYGLTAQLKQNITYVNITITPGMTLDYLANKYYGRPDYYWGIADFNHIKDPFINLSDWFNTIKIPSLGSLEFED